ncbi:MAG TPA: glycosyltransferase [Verrucomicrobiae bacterium]|nr:glycosyltransferase [Verrucomicrobiae bacterium]
MANLFFVYFLAVFLVWSARAAHALRMLATAPRVSLLKSGASGRELVTIIVPAKNEEKNIRACIEGLLAQDYPHFEIIVVNDNSTDRTEEILLSLGAAALSGNAPNASTGRLKYLNGKKTPEGWTGKNHALHQAIPHARGAWYLFTDADTRHEPSCLSSALAHALSNGLNLLSLLPRCLAESPWEHLLQPPAMGYLGLWFPLDKINDPESPVFFGNGQYLLIHSELYGKTGGHEAVRHAFLEDFALVEKTKALGQRAGVAMGMDVYGTRMYSSFDEIWRGWRRIYLHAFQSKLGALVLKALDILFFSVLPFAIFPTLAFLVSQDVRYMTAVILAVVTVLLVLGTAYKTHQIVRARKRFCLAHPLAAAVLFGVLMDACGMAAFKTKTVWR